MKITAIKAEKIKMELKEPLKVAFGIVPYSENILVKIETDEGIAGYGEGAPLSFVTGENITSAFAAFQMFQKVLAGMDVMDLEGIHSLMDRTIEGNTSVKCAVDLALYDIRGKMCGQPVY